jgi:sporulation protein YlmC with PRC-barrel domain
MLRSLKDLERYAVSATDGDTGSVEDFLLDDERWAIRYLVADTGGFLDGRRVLISPISFRETDWSARHFHLALTKEKIEHSPSIDVAKPVSRQHEREFNLYYGYPYYWGYSGLWGMAGYPLALAARTWVDEHTQHFDESADVHLRSASEVRGYHIQGSDGAIGHVDDFIIDDETWVVRYLVIDTKNWWFGKKVLVAPHWASRVSWEERKVFVDLSRQAIKNGPEWDASAAINREYETRMYDYYGRPAYWEGGGRPEEAPPARYSGSHPG